MRDRRRIHYDVSADNLWYVKKLGKWMPLKDIGEQYDCSSSKLFRTFIKAKRHAKNIPGALITRLMPCKAGGWFIEEYTRKGIKNENMD